MITFSPIHKNIQETLLQKMKMLEKNPSISIGTTVATEDGNTNENYMMARSPFLRMTSLLTKGNKPVVIMGGEMKNNKFQQGYDSIYGQRSGIGDEENKNPMKRPIAGISNVSVEYKGGGMKLGATRSATIEWTCWTWDDLQQLKPFFLKHGRTVLIEFGWSFSGKDAPRFIDILDDNGEIKSATLKDTKGKSLQDKLPEHIIKQKGHYDAVLGIIQNFEFNVNETGGFDCKTDLISLGVSTVQKMESKESLAGNIANLPISNPKNEDAYMWWNDKEYTTSLKSSYALEPYYNFKAYIGSFQGHLHKNAKNSKGSIAFLASSYVGDDEKILRDTSSTIPYCTWGWFEDNVLSRFLGVVNKDDAVVTEFRSIENSYDETGNSQGAQSVVIQTSKDMLSPDFGKWFFVQDEETGFIEEVGVGVMGTMLGTTLEASFVPSIVGGHAIHSEMYEEAFGKVPTKVTEGTKVKYTPDDYFRVFTPDGLGTSGHIRNIYFNSRFLQDCFKDISTIREGVESVWNKFSAAYGGIYDFKMDLDEKEGKVMIKDFQHAISRVDEVLQNKSTDENYSLDNPGLFVFPIWEKNSMVKSQNLSAKLPNRMQMAAMYGSNNATSMEDGLVDNYDDWGATALGKTEKKGEETIEGQEKLYDRLFGSIEHPFRRSIFDEEGAKTLGQKEGKTGDELDAFMVEKYQEHLNTATSMTFGNASADINTPLKWESGPSSDTTSVYEDVEPDTEVDDGKMHIESDIDSSYSTNKEHPSYGMPFLGINEILEMQLHEEFQRRMRVLIGEDEKEGEQEELDSSEIIKYQSIWNQKETLKEKKEIFNAKSEFMPQYFAMKSQYQGLMKMSLRGDAEGILKQTDPIIPIELELEIDGMGGIFPGNSFHTSYLPKGYMDRVCFQVKGANHSIDSSGWSTTLTGQMRVRGITKEEGRKANTALQSANKKAKDMSKAPTTTSSPGESYTYTTTHEVSAEMLEDESTVETLLVLDDDNNLDNGVQYSTDQETTAIDDSAVEIANNQLKFDLLQELMTDEEKEAYETYQNMIFAQAKAIEKETASFFNFNWNYTDLAAAARALDDANQGLIDLGAGTSPGVSFLQWFMANEGDQDKIPTDVLSHQSTEIGWALNNYLSETNNNQNNSLNPPEGY